MNDRALARIVLAVVTILLGGAVAFAFGINRSDDEGDVEPDPSRFSLSLSRPAVSRAAMSPAQGAPTVTACPQTVLPSNGATSFNARAPHGGYVYGRSVWLITAAEAAANGLLTGAAPSAIGFRYSSAPSGPAAGTLKVYLENTTDATNTKGGTWATAITGMTTVHNAAIALPATTAPFDIPFSLGAPFTYTGGGLYVAFDWHRTGAATGGTVVACNTSLTGGLQGAQSNTAAPTTTLPSVFRPETRFSVGVPNDASVDYVISYGSLAQTLVGPQTVQAVITNRGTNELSNLGVTFNLTGVETFSDTQYIAGPLQACGGQTTVTFDPFTPSAIGSDTVTVSVPADDNASNNSKARPLDETHNLYSYKHPGTTADGGVGFSGATGAFVGKFTTAVAAKISAVNLEFFAASATAFRVAIYPESAPDSGVPSATPLYEDASDRTVLAAGSVSIALPSLPAVGPGTFFAGVHQTNAVTVKLSFDAETPVRSGSFFGAVPWPVALATDWFEFAADGSDFKLNIGVTLIECSTVVDCDDGNACTADACTNQLCLYPVTNCDDGDVCTDDSCDPGVGCVHTSDAASWDDGNACTNDSCDPIAGVQHVNNTAACNDATVCNGNEVCGGGTCNSGTPPVVNDGNVCTNDSCDPITGVQHVNNTLACNDATVCNGNEVCGDGSCNPGTPPVVNDGNVCTNDSCHPTAGVQHVNNTLACNDATVCNGNEVCGGGTCNPGTPPVVDDGNVCTNDSCDPIAGVQHVNNTNACNDATVCNGGEVCGGGSCNPGTPPVVNDGNACTNDSCDPIAGVQHVNNTVACNDATVCNGSEVCGGGSCNPGTPLVVNDGNVCTNDSCDPIAGVQHVSNTVACNDATVCNGSEVCGGGSCNPGTPLVVNDGNVCTNDSCDPITGVQHVNNTVACNDATVCNGNEVCGGGVCNSGTPLVVDDGNVCTTDSCDPIAGVQHVNNETACNDATVCNGTEVCGGGTCNPGTPPVVNDGNVCTNDSCHPITGVQHVNNTVACNDATVCNGNEQCGGGTCNSGTPLVVDDGNVCTNDSCDPITGVQNVNNTAACNDATVCNGNEVCGGGTCNPGTPPVVNDGNVCTNDSCDPIAGVQHVNNTVACNDATVCNGNEVCGGGTCNPGTPLVVDDGNVCTNDSCDPISGVQHLNNTAACNDATVCNGNEVCGGGTCNPGTPLLVNDGNVCTNDSCDPIAGVQHVNNTAACNDATVCNGNELCGGGTCNPGTPLVVDDGNGCTNDSCDPITGVQNVNNTAACNDQTVCNGSEVCGGGTCNPGTPPVVNDGNVCTNDSCDPIAGVQHVNNTAACNDATVCNGSEVCGGGTCNPGTPLIVDDGNVCTNDSCDPIAGVLHVNNTAACNDGNACTIADACAAGACSGTAITAPPETTALRWTSKIAVSWTAAAFATRYDVVRGSVGALPVGPGGGDEVCFGDLSGTLLADATLPASGAGFWYLSRGENTCGNGTYGNRGVQGLPGAARTTTTCP